MKEPCITCKERNRCSRENEGHGCDDWELDYNQCEINELIYGLKKAGFLHIVRIDDSDQGNSPQVDDEEAKNG